MMASATTAQPIRPRTRGQIAKTTAPMMSSGMKITAAWMSSGCAGIPPIVLNTVAPLTIGAFAPFSAW